MKLPWLLGGVFVLFCSILVICYQIAEQSHPVFVDQNGRPTNTPSSSAK
jgi:hypothetical protein